MKKIRWEIIFILQFIRVAFRSPVNYFPNFFPNTRGLIEDKLVSLRYAVPNCFLNTRDSTLIEAG